MSSVTLSKQPRKTPQAGKPAGEAKSPRLWHASTPKEVSKACRHGEAGAGWVAWQSYLSKRREPAPLGRLLGGKAHPLLWNLPEECTRANVSSARLLSLLANMLSQQPRPARGKGSKPAPNRRPPRELASCLAAWVENLDGEVSATPFAITALAVAHAAPRLAEALGPEVWWNTLDLLVDVSREAKLGQFDDPLGPLLLTGELPWTLAYLFPEITYCRSLAAEARRRISADLLDALDGEGLPHHRLWDWFRPLAASWTRCLAMRLEWNADQSALNNEALTQYEWAVLQMLRLSRAGGGQMFSGDARGAWTPALFQAALGFLKESDDAIAQGTWVAASQSLPAAGRPTGKRPRGADEIEPAVESEWSGAAILRSGWTPSAPRLAVRYERDRVELECEAGGETLLAGPWTFAISVDGAAARAIDDWEQVCWVTDEDVDYLELRITLENNLRLERQILLARQDQFLLLADNLLADNLDSAKAISREWKLAYEGGLPLGPAMQWSAEEETREGTLAGRRPRAVVMPLALPEWRVDLRRGELRQEAGSLMLRQEGRGRGLCCPLWFDLAGRRLAKQRTWRQLTVAESLEIVPFTSAAGYRVQSGNDQWMIYRSLAKKANRSLLGQNTSSEFVLGRFRTAGEIDELLEIE